MAITGSTYQKLKNKIKKETDFDLPNKAYRTHAGYWQRSKGAFSWFVLGDRDIGSQWSMSQLLKSHCIELSKIDGAIHFDPCNHTKEF